MGQAIGGTLPLAVGITLSPFPIIAVVLMLTTPRARRNGPAFVTGWLIGLAVVGAIVLAFAGGSQRQFLGGAGDVGELGKDRARRSLATAGVAAVPRSSSPGRSGRPAQVDGND